jgi:hypothetical protein
MPYLLAGPFVAIVGILAVFFVLRRKSVDKRSMYSARRSQIEHKVRAARQRTLTPRGRSRPAEQTIPVEAPSPFATQAPQTVAYEAPAYQAAPVAPPAPPPFQQPEPAPSQSPWDMPAAAPAAAPAFDYPPAPPEPAYTPPQPEPYSPPSAAPAEPAWTPAAEPAPPAERLEPAAQQTASATAAAGSWSIVTPEGKETATVAPDGKKKKDKGGAPASSWELASGEAPGAEADEPQVRRSNATLMAVAQYAVLVVGLVMVLIGVIVMVANSHVT